MTTYHPVLERQLRKSGMTARDLAQLPPCFAEVLARVSSTYVEADQDRYTVERTMSELSSEMQQLYEDLRLRTDAIHEATLESSTDGVLIVDTDGRILSFNTRFLDMWQIPSDVAATRDWRATIDSAMKLMRDPDAFRAQTQLLTADTHGSGRDEIELLDGRMIERHTAPVISAAGHLLGRGWFLRDVTEVRRRQAELREARDAAEEAARAKSAFLANMSHELRTPLNAILGFARILRRTDDDQRELFDLIVSAGEHMLSLVNDLLDLRRIEDTSEPPTISLLDAADVIEEALDLVRPMMAERHHVVEVAYEDGLPGSVRADHRAMLQVLLNLLSNAAKFTPQGGRIRVEATPEPSHGRMRISVTDNGIGIDAPGIARLFTYYAQLNGKVEHGMKGSGIGLALTRALVQRTGGEIDVRSAVGEGSTFSFTLPLAYEGAAARDDGIGDALAGVTDA